MADLKKINFKGTVLDVSGGGREYTAGSGIDITNGVISNTAQGATYNGITPIVVSGQSISHANSGVTAGSKGDTANQTPGFGDTFKATSQTVDAKGHVTAQAEHTVKIPNSKASGTADGLMSKEDKTKLDGLAAYTSTAPISVTGTTISHDNSGVTAGAKGDTVAQQPAFGGTFKVTSQTVDAKGHTTALGEHTVTIPSSKASSTADGLMSKEDKAKLDGVKTYSAGDNVEISSTGVISATDTTTYGGTLPTGTDLNAIRTENKVYLCSSSNTYTNLPTGAAYGSLVVEKSSPTTQSTIVQRFSNLSKSWFRMYINGQWYAWVELTKDEGSAYTGASPIVVSGTEISHADSGATAGTYGSWTTEDVTPAFGGTFYVPSFKVNAKGHVTAGQHHKVKIPNAGASSTAAGLMSAADKIKLDSMSWYDATISVGTLNAGAAKTDQTYTIPTSVMPSNKTTIALSGFYLSGTGYQDCSITRIHLAARTIGWTVANHGTVSRSGLSLVVRFLSMTM